MKVLLIDNYDSFSYMLKDYLEQFPAHCDVFRNDEIPEPEKIQEWDALVLSPGPRTPLQAGTLMPFLSRVFDKIPILGICLGHQAIGSFFGAKLVKAALPVHGKTCVVSSLEDDLFKSIPTELETTRYHSLILENVKIPLEVIAFSPTREVMAIRHVSLPIRGIQFHPESCKTAYGLEIIKNFLTFAKDKS